MVLDTRYYQVVITSIHWYSKVGLWKIKKTKRNEIINNILLNTVFKINALINVYILLRVFEIYVFNSASINFAACNFPRGELIDTCCIA